MFCFFYEWLLDIANNAKNILGELMQGCNRSVPDANLGRTLD